MRFSQKKLEQMIAEKSRLENEIQEVAVQLQNEIESDEWGTDKGKGKLTRFFALQEKREGLMRDRDKVEAKREKYEDHSPENSSPRDWGRQVLQRWARHGIRELDESEREMFVTPADADIMVAIEKQMGFPVPDHDGLFMPGGLQMAAGDATRADGGGGTDSDWGDAAPERWRAGLVETLRYAGAVAEMCQNFSTENGNIMHVNQMDSSAEEGGSIVDQSAASTGVPAVKQIASVGDLEFGATWRHSNFMDVRFETLADVHFDAAGRVVREMTRRMGRGWNKQFTVGAGTGAALGVPQGIVPSATVVDGGAGSAYDGSGGVDYPNLLDMEYGIDLAYLEGNEGFEGGFADGEMGMIGWMMNRNVERGLRTAVDGDSRPIWSPNLETGRAIQGAPGRINGYPYRINQHMADGKAVDDLPMLFGNCGHYGVRNIGGPMFFRFSDSATMARFAVRFFGVSRRQGRSLGPHLAAKNEAYAVLQVKA